MNYRNLYLLTGIVAFLSSATSAQIISSEPADLLLRGGRVVTPNGVVQSIAVRNGRIVALGDDRSLDLLRGVGTKVVDLNGRTVLPGFHDSHIHAVEAGLLNKSCRFPPASKPSQITARIAECVKAAKPGQWISGGSYQADMFGSTPPDRAMLDAVSPDNPVLLVDVGFHNVWVNSAALKLAGITRDTKDPPAGRIVRRADGQPSGVLNEMSARALVGKYMPRPTVTEKQEALAWTLSQLASWGVTSLTEAGADADTVAAYVGLADAGRLKQRVRTCIHFAPGRNGDGSWDGKLSQMVIARNEFSRERLTTDCVKLGIDGVASNSQTAAMLDGYVIHGEGAETGNGMKLSQPLLDDIVARLDQEGVTVKMHAIGDGAVRSVIDAIAKVRRNTGVVGPTHSIAHASFIAPADLKRMADMNLSVDISPYSLFRAPMTEEIERNVGVERMAHWKPVRQLLDQHVLTVAGSDWPAGPPTANPWLEIETMVTRLPPGGVGKPLAPSETATLDEAITMFTDSGARERGHRNVTGAIENGLYADLIVIDRDPHAIPVTDLHNIKVVTTIIGGEIVYEAAAK
jgi:predicted amidohydrolase YtcJ